MLNTFLAHTYNMLTMFNAYIMTASVCFTRRLYRYFLSMDKVILSMDKVILPMDEVILSMDKVILSMDKI